MASEYMVDFFQPADAQGVVDLFRSVYGEDYHVKSIYDPHQLIAEQASGQTYRAVARTPEGAIIAHTAFYAISDLNPVLYEAGQLLVRHDWRGTSLAVDLNNFAIPQIPVRYNLREIWGEAVCNHLFSQRMYTEHRYGQTGLELDLLPGAGMARSMQAADTGRVSTVVVFRSYRARPRTVYLPPFYREQLEFLYADFDHGHTFAAAVQDLPVDEKTAARPDIYDAVSVARLNVTRLGGDFPVHLADFNHQARRQNIHLSEVFLPLTAPSVGAAVTELRRAGYFLGGIMPRWFGDDALLLQKVAGEPNFDGIRLYTDRARDILSLVKADWQLACRGG